MNCEAVWIDLPSPAQCDLGDFIEKWYHKQEVILVSTLAQFVSVGTYPREPTMGVEAFCIKNCGVYKPCLYTEWVAVLQYNLSSKE